MTSQIQHFEADFLWKVSLKILNSGIILKTFIHAVIFTFLKQSFNESLDFCNRSYPHEFQKIRLTAAKLTCPCNTLRTLNSFARSDTGIVIDSKLHLSPTLQSKPLVCSIGYPCSQWLFCFSILHSN